MRELRTYSSAAYCHHNEPFTRFACSSYTLTRFWRFFRFE